MPSGFIDDGYTIDATIRGKERQYDSIVITYRPLLRREMWHHSQSVASAKEKQDLEKIDELVAELLDNKLASWTLKDRSGEIVPITKENLLRLHTDLFTEIMLVVLRSSDKDNSTAKNS